MYEYLNIELQHRVDYVRIDVIDFIAEDRSENGWIKATQSALKSMCSLEDAVMLLQYPSGRWSGGIPTNYLTDSDVDPFVLTMFHLNTPEAGALASFRYPGYWLLGNSVYAVLNAASVEMGYVLQIPTDVYGLTIDRNHFTPTRATFELNTYYDDQCCRVQFAIERLSCYQSRRQEHGMLDRSVKIPCSWYQYEIAMRAFLDDYCNVRNLPLKHAQQTITKEERELNEPLSINFDWEDLDLTGWSL